MTIRPKFPPHQPMTVEEYLAFTDTRPDDERWELIEGVPVLNPAPIDYHQIICTNIATFLMNEKQRLDASWLPLLGIGTRVPVSPKSLPQPDVFVLEGAPTGNVSVGCVHGHEVRVDCGAAGLSCAAVPGSKDVGACVSPPAPQGADRCDGKEARCDGATIKYCFAGKKRSYFCKSLGFDRCVSDAKGTRCSN